jgi:ATP-binding cassette subfamily B protein
MQHGRIIELGTHAELMTVGGRYAELYEYQARAFLDDEEVIPVATEVE